MQVHFFRAALVAVATVAFAGAAIAQSHTSKPFYSQGRVYLLDRLPLKGDRVARTITLPSYIPDVATVQIYCAWAEAVLGEAPFAAAMKLTN